MTYRITVFMSSITFTVMLAGGCMHALPHYTWHDTNTALSTMTARDNRIQTISTTFSLLLQSGKGQIELKGAIVARPPNHFRLRVWKLTRTVMDVTLNKDGLFVFTADRKDKSASPTDKLTHERLIEALSMLPGFGDMTTWKIGASTNQHGFALNKNTRLDHATLTCTVDKSTLTTSTCTYFDEQSKVRQVLTLDAYRPIHNIVWPMHVKGSGDGGDFEIHFSRVDINEELSKRAFVPSRRAKKQP